MEFSSFDFGIASTASFDDPTLAQGFSNQFIPMMSKYAANIEHPMATTNGTFTPKANSAVTSPTPPAAISTINLKKTHANSSMSSFTGSPSEAFKKWEMESEANIREMMKKEADAREEMQETAATKLKNWKEQRQKQLEAIKQKEETKESERKVSTGAEKHSWDAVRNLIDLNATVSGTKDISRMQEILKDIDAKTED